MQSSTDTKTQKAAKADLKDIVNNASDIVHPAIEQLTAKAHDTVDRLATAANHGVENFELKTEQLTATGQRMGAAMRSQIQQRPATVVGIAVAAGFLLSWLLRARSPSNSGQ